MPPKNPRKYKRRTGVKKAVKHTTAEIKDIAKGVVYGIAESKYFNTTTHSEKIPVPVQLLANMTCLGFTTGDQGDSVTGADYQYGTTSMRPLNVQRVYDRNQSAPLNNMALEGLYATPAYCQSRFVVERLSINSSNIANSPNRALPYFVRVMRMKARPRKSSNQTVQPNLDAFMTRQGLPTGVFVAGFSKLDIMTLKANTRKYQLIEDKKFIMNAPMTYNDLNIDDGTYNIQRITDSVMRTMNFSHNIGKKLFYKAPDANPDPNYPTSGFQNEFILFHFQALGDDDTSRSAANQVRISVQPVSTFKDV